MLQLIVLGQIPGTHLQLTFAWFQVVVLGASAYGSYRLYKLHLEKIKKNVQQQYDQISLQHLDQA